MQRQLIVFGSACVLLALVLSCDDPFEHSKCRTVETGKSVSPDGRYEAALSRHFCKPDAKETIALQVEVRHPGSGFANPGAVVFHVAGGHEINLVWEDANNLRIECAGAREDEVVSQHDRWEEVNISYRFK